MNFCRITFWKIVFAVIIAWFHFNKIYSGIYEKWHISDGWYIGVEFFFLVSGFFLAEHFEKRGGGTSPVRYVCHRLKKLYPHYIFSFVIMFVAMCLARKYTGRQTVQYLGNSVCEIFLLQTAGLNRASLDFVNNVTWYLSAMLLAGYVISFLLCHMKKYYIRLIIPAGTLYIYSYLYRVYGHICVWEYTEGFFWNTALLRAFADMGLGVMCYEIYRKSAGDIRSVFGKRLLSGIEILGYLFVIFCSFQYGYTGFDFLYIAVLAGCVLLSVLNENTRFFDNRVISFLGELTYPMYLNHNLLRRVVFPLIFPPNQWDIRVAGVYMAVLVLYSFVTCRIVGKLEKLCFRRKWIEK